MFMRFTDRARKVMAFANEEAKRRNSEDIGTEDILLALIREGSGIGVSVLKSLGADFHKIPRQIERLAGRKSAAPPAGDAVSSSGVKKITEHAMQEARDLGQNYVGTEHILLGLLREQDGLAARVLASIGLKLDKVREEIRDLLGAEPIRSPGTSGGESAVRHAGVSQAEAEAGRVEGDQFEYFSTNDPAATLLHLLLREFAACKDRAVMNADYEMAVAYRDMTETAQKLMNQLVSFLAGRQPPKDGG